MAKLEVIVPVYNEENSLKELTYRITKTLEEAGIDYGITYVDDHSSDNSTVILEEIVQNSDRVKLLRKKGKKGKAYSILEGARASNAPFIAMIDGDLQYPPEVLPEMFELAKENGVVVANRKNHETGLIRKIGSRLNSLLFERFLLKLKCDTQSGLKVFKREVIENLTEEDVSPWTLDMPLLMNAIKLGYKIAEVDINFVRRISGESKVNFAKVGTEIALSALKLRFNGRSTEAIKPANGDPVLGAGINHNGQRFITHNRLPQSQSAVTTFEPWQILTIFSLILLALIAAIINPIITAITFVGFLSILYFIDLLFNLRILLKSLDAPPEVKATDEEIFSLRETDLPVYSILCPLYKEANVLTEFINAIKKIDWPREKLDVILLLEEDDAETINAVNDLYLPSYIRSLVVPHSFPKTKPKACNYGLAHARGEFVVIYDAEDRPDPLQLKKAYVAFSKLSSDVVCLQSKLNYYNTDHNLLTKLFSAEYSLWFDLILPGLQSIETTIPLGGTSNHFKAHTLRYLDAWDAFNVTEDCDLGTRLFRKGFKTAILDSTTYEEANSKMGSWVKQRSRWIKGYFQTYLVHMRDPVVLFSEHGIHALIFQLVIGMRMVFMIINPILWIATISYFALNSFAGPALEAIYPAPIFYIAVTSLVFGNFISLYTYMIGCAKRSSWGLIKYVFLVPIYWVMASIAAYLAFYQLIFKPHYWEKTQHGLDMQKSKSKLPRVKISIDLDLSLHKGLAKRVISGLYWPVSFVWKNLIDFGRNRKLRIIFNRRAAKRR